MGDGIIMIIGFVAAVITIFVFVTGVPSISEIAVLPETGVTLSNSNGNQDNYQIVAKFTPHSLVIVNKDG